MKYMIDLINSEDMYINDIDRMSVIEAPVENSIKQELIFFFVMLIMGMITYYSDYS